MASVPLSVPSIVPTVDRDFVSPQRDQTKFHLLSAETIDSNDVDSYCRAAETFEAGLSRTAASAGKTVALLFFQASTRTRIGFEAAVASLGAIAIGVDDMSAASRSNARSGETLEDCAAVVSRFSDVIVVRHHEI